MDKKKKRRKTWNIVSTILTFFDYLFIIILPYNLMEPSVSPSEFLLMQR